MITRHRSVVQGPPLKRPPSVTLAQWGLAALALGAAGLGYLFPSHDDLVVFTGLLTALSGFLVLMVAKEAVRTRILGKLFLIASTLIFFWLEAFDLAHESPPFVVPEGVPGLGLQFSQDLIQQALFYVALFQVMLFVGYSIRPKVRRVMSWIGSRVDASSIRIRMVCYALVACAWVPLLVSYELDVQAAIEGLLAARSGTGPESGDVGLLHYLYFFGMYGAAILLTEALIFRTVNRFWGLLLGGAASLPFILGGARHLWLFVAAPACTLAITRLPGRANLSRLVRWVGIGAVTLFVIQLQYAVREVGWRSIGDLTPTALLQGSTTGQFTALLFAEQLVPDTHDYFREPVEPYFLIHWIPRKFWSEKPVMRSWSYYNQAYTRESAYNVTPSVIGQFHINWGILGVVFIGIWLGFLTYLADRALLALDLNRQRAMAVTVGMFYAFIVSSFRFYSPVYFTYFAFAVLGMFLLSGSERALRVVHTNAPAPARHLSLP